MGFVTDTIGSIFGGAAADASMAGAELAAGGQQNALDFLMSQSELPTQLRDQALTSLGGLYLGGEGGQEALANLQQSPIYGAVMSGLQNSEDAIMRNAAATGGLRSGNVQNALSKNAQQLQNQALMQSMGGLNQLAGLNTNTNQIANTMSGIGQTLGQGQVASGQALQTGLGMGLNTLGAVGQAFFSDARLKESIHHIGDRNGIGIYTWIWNKDAEKFGLKGEATGCIAQELEKTHPDLVGANNGYKTVNMAAVQEIVNR